MNPSFWHMDCRCATHLVCQRCSAINMDPNPQESPTRWACGRCGCTPLQRYRVGPPAPVGLALGGVVVGVIFGGAVLGPLGALVGGLVGAIIGALAPPAMVQR